MANSKKIYTVRDHLHKYALEDRPAAKRFMQRFNSIQRQLDKMANRKERLKSLKILMEAQLFLLQRRATKKTD